MILKIERASLYELLRSFYEVTGIKTAVYNDDLEEILAYPEDDSCLCSEIRKRHISGCTKSNEILFKKCKECDGVVINKCHAGLTEAAMPLRDNGVVVGYIMYGQITNELNRESLTNKIASVYGHNTYELINDIRYYSDSQLKAISKIFDSLTSYIVLKRYVYTEEKPVIYSIMEYIMQNLQGDLSINELCRQFNISRSELYKLSKPYMIDGIAAFVKTSRLRRAAELLRRTDKPIWEIAEETGFADKEYFLRVFKQRYGVSARKYRKQV